MAKRKQYVELVAHPKLTSTEFHNCRQHKKLFDILSAYVTALSSDVPDVCVTEVKQHLAGSVLKITLGTSQGLHLMRIDYAIVNGECLLYGYRSAISPVCGVITKSASHSYILSQATKMGAQLRNKSQSVTKLTDSVRDRIGEISTYVSRLVRDLKISVNYKLSEGKNTYNLRYTYDEEQLQQLALYAFDRANHPVINPDIVKIYEEWRTGYNKTNQVNAEVEEFFNRPKWMLIVSRDPEVSEALPMELKANTRYLVGATRGEEVVVPFQMYNSLDDLPKEIHDSLIVSLMMARVYSAGQGIELDDDFVPKDSPYYRHSRVVYKDIGYIHNGESNYSTVMVELV